MTRRQAWSFCGVNGTGTSMRPSDPRITTRWYGASCSALLNTSWPPSGKFQHAAGHPIDAKLRIAIDQGDGAMRFGAEHIAGGDDGIAADVVQRTAADIGAIAHIVGVEHREHERRLNRAHRCRCGRRAPARGCDAIAGESAP